MVFYNHRRSTWYVVFFVLCVTPLLFLTYTGCKRKWLSRTRAYSVLVTIQGGDDDRYRISYFTVDENRERYATVPASSIFVVDSVYGTDIKDPAEMLPGDPFTAIHPPPFVQKQQ